MTRLPALAASLLLPLGLMGCAADEPTPAASTSAPASSPPASLVPDRSFTEPTGSRGVELGDYIGRWGAQLQGLPCTENNSYVRWIIIDDSPGGAVLNTGPHGHWITFAPAAIVDGRWVADLDLDVNGWCSTDDLRIELDCVTGRVAFYGDQDELVDTSTIRRTSRPSSGPCTY